MAEVEARRLHLVLGYSSLYDYCRKRLALSDFEAFSRIAAARVARKYPIVFGMLERRELHLTAICELRDFLTADNHRELLIEASHKTKLQIREQLARRFPQADVPSTLKQLPALDPLSPGRYRLLLTLNAEQKEKLELARDLLSHANPSGDFAVVLERALDALIARTEARRFGQPRTLSNKPRAIPPAIKIQASPLTGSNTHSGERVDETSGANAGEDTTAAEQRAEQKATSLGTTSGKRDRRKHIPHTVRREILARDGARCAFVSSDGRRCEGRGFLQFHHQHPWACGGADTADNLALLCHARNHLLAEWDFGRLHIDGHIEAHIARRPVVDTRDAAEEIAALDQSA